jgi:predicted GIY-YIG superfamily endonuclease
MISDKLTEFVKCFDFKEAPKQAPKLPGAYLLRLKGGKKFNRINGETDIVYIGSTDNLSRRFYGYNHPGRSQYTNQKVNDFVIKFGHDVEFMWKEEPDGESARITESELLKKYQKKHHEYPPLNGASVRSLEKTLTDEKLNLSDESSTDFSSP